MTYLAAIILVASGLYLRRLRVATMCIASAEERPIVWASILRLVLLGAVLGQAIVHICRVVAKEVQ